MKTYLTLILLFFVSIFYVQGQHAFENIQKQELEDSKETFALTEAQITNVNRILQRKFEQLESIESIKTESPDIYAQQRRAIFIGYSASFERMLNKAQIKIYQSEKHRKRIFIAQKIEEWKDDAEREEKIKDLKAGVKDY